MSSLDLSIFILQFLCFASFVWAGLFMFKIPDSSAQRAKKFLSTFGFGFMLLNSYAVWSWLVESESARWLSLALFTASLLLFWWTVKAVRDRPPDFAFGERAPQRLLTAGPFGWFRHPFYLAYTLSWLGGCVGTQQISVIVCAVVMIAAYLIAARMEEQKILASPFGSQYQEIRRQVGLLGPKFWNTKKRTS